MSTTAKIISRTNKDPGTAVEPLEGRTMLAVDAAIQNYQARAAQVIGANVASVTAWAAANAGATDNIATGNLSEWTAAAAFTQTNPATLNAGYKLAASLMEKAGTGGALFRNLYRDFLDEAATHLPAKAKRIKVARAAIASSAEMWTRIAVLIDQAASDGRAQPLLEASALCRPISENEAAAMQALAEL